VRNWPETRNEARTKGEQMKGAQKPKKGAKKPAEKSLKEKRAAKRAAAKTGRLEA
jgi:hypothetical protein